MATTKHIKTKPDKDIDVFSDESDTDILVRFSFIQLIVF